MQMCRFQHVPFSLTWLVLLTIPAQAGPGALSPCQRYTHNQQVHLELTEPSQEEDQFTKHLINEEFKALNSRSYRCLTTKNKRAVVFINFSNQSEAIAIQERLKSEMPSLVGRIQVK